MATEDTRALPSEFDGPRLRRIALQTLALLTLLVVAAIVMPGLDDVRRHFTQADWRWMVAAVALEALSCLSYVLMFRPVFCRTMSARSALEIGWAELGAGALVPASGASGVALGAWVLGRDGMPAERIARRSVAFLLIKSSVNFVAVAVLGIAMALGVGASQPLWLTLVPAVMSIGAIGAVVWIGRRPAGEAAPPDASRPRRWWAALRRWVVTGAGDAGAILRSRDVPVIAGAIGYWAFDNAVLWATFHAVGDSPPITVILMGYLIGQMGGLLPIPGGIGGIDGGLLGTLVVYGAPAAATGAAVLLYRVVLFWLPLVGGAIAFSSLRRGLLQPGRPDLCRATAPS
jgi:uncharacterized membrane protein YbhN (UPF0104 family)